MVRNKKRFLVLGLIIVICLFFYFLSKVFADIASNVVDTSTSSTATQKSSQRKTFYDSSNSLYWVFYNNGSAIEYSYSSNGSSWSSGGTTGVATSDFSVWYVSGTTTVYLAYDDSTGIKVEKGTLAASSIGWGTATVAGSSSYDAHVAISRDSNGMLWIAYHTGSTTRYAYAKRSTYADDPSLWDAPKTLGSGSSTAGTGFDYFSILPMTTSGNMYFIYDWFNTNACSIRGHLWTDSSSTMGGATTIVTPAADEYFPSSAVSMATDVVHLIYDDCSSGCSTGGEVFYAEYSSGSWNTPIAIDTNTSDLFPTLTKNGTDLYAFYIRSNSIYYRKGVSPYASGNWGGPNTLVSSGTNTSLTSSYDNSNNYAIMTWTEGTSTPWNVRFYGLSLGSSGPTKIVFTNAARTLTVSACNGAASVFTMQLQDNGGTPQNPTQTTVVQVTSNSSSYTIYSDSNCGTPVSGGNFTYTTSDNTKSVYIIDNKKSISTRTLTGTRTSGDTLTTGTQDYTVNAGSVTQLVITLPGQTFTDGSGNSGTVLSQASGVAFSIQLYATDSNFNVNTSYTGDKTLVFSGPSVGYLNPTVTDKNGTNQNYGSNTVITFSNGATTGVLTTLYKAETTTITATDGGNYGLASASLTVTSSTTVIKGGTLIKGGTQL